MSSDTREDDPDVTNAEKTTLTTNVEQCVRESKGDFIAGGASGIVERLLSGDIVKSPWPGAHADESRRDLTVESHIYKRLGSHPRLIQIIAWHPKECSLIMEYMPNGCLKDYLLANNEKVTTAQRLRWAQEAAEGLQLLHAANVIHCDVEPKNFLLDADLSLKIADFSGSSLDGSNASACAGTRFLPPSFDWRSPPTIQNDLFGLGSTIYTIMTGRYPFQEVSSREVERLYAAQDFPDVTHTLCGAAIQRCWLFEIGSAQEVYNLIKEKGMNEL
ncbi:spindle assembly checkpoint kinase [Leptodontidium sp. MPI-SDFR-AT-0119]|nr:spindle assembly checkpoint kinase [Leptodontidium sp. MPI-SDFR-AT-0119]